MTRHFLWNIGSSLEALFNLSSYDEDVERARDALEKSSEEISSRRDRDMIAQDFYRVGMDIQNAMNTCHE